jgi:hypothetical protein
MTDVLAHDAVTSWTGPDELAPIPTFTHAQALLVGLTGCTLESAARALLGTAAQLGLSPVRTAHLLLQHVATHDQPDSESFVARLERAARDRQRRRRRGLRMVRPTDRSG